MTPYRPGNEVTQSFSDGLVTVYEVTDSADPGYLPREQLNERVKLRYAEQRLGVTRYFAAQQAQIQIERVIRVPDSGLVSVQDVAIDEAGKQYRIEMIQLAQNVWPRCVDLTLSRIEQGYVVPNSGTGEEDGDNG